MNLMDNLNFFSNLGKKMQPNKTLYFLDLNILIYIEKYNKNKLDDNFEIIQNLKKLDNEKSIITIFTSALEGCSGDIETDKEDINKQINSIYKDLSTFFKQAKVDKSIQKDVNELFLDARLDEETIVFLKSKNDFLKEILPILKQPQISKDKEVMRKNNARDEIVQIAKKYQLNEWNPIVMYVLYMLYDSGGQKIIKKKENKIEKDVKHYNSIMDFQHLYLFLACAAKLHNRYIPKYNANIVCHFETNDVALKKFLEIFDLNSITSEYKQNGNISITCNFKDLDYFENFIEFFPDDLAKFYRELIIEK